MIAFGESIKSIAESMNKSTSSVEKSLKSLREKIDAHSNPDMTRIMIDLGYIPPEPTELMAMAAFIASASKLIRLNESIIPAESTLIYGKL